MPDIHVKETHLAARHAFIVLLFGCLVSIALTWLHVHSNRDRAAELFSRQADAFRELVRSRLQIYEYGVRGARGAVVGAGGLQISRERFLEYTATREIEREFPGARGFGFIRRILPEGRAALLERGRQEYGPGFTIKQLAPNDGDWFVINYIEPQFRNQEAVGLDIASEPTRKHAAETAMATGNPTLTAPITLVQASGEISKGFLLLIPVYASQKPIDTAPQRIAATLGWAYAPLLITEVLDGVADDYPQIAFNLADDTDGLSPASFFASTNAAGASTHALSESGTLEVYGRTWLVEAQALPGFQRSLGLLPSAWVLMVSLLLSLMIAGLVYAIRLPIERKGRLQQEQEALTRGVIETSPQALIVADQAGKIIRANQRVTDIFGYLPSQLLGHSVEVLLPKASHSKHRALRAGYDHTARAMSARKDLFAVHADGREFPVEVNLSPLQLNEQQLVVAAVQDVTEQRAAVARLQDSEARWRQLANSMPQLVWTCAADGPCTFLSERWVDYTGIDEHEQLGYRWLDQIHPDDQARLQTQWMRAVDTVSELRVEYRIRRHDGAFRWFDTQAKPLLDEQGKMLMWIGANTDIHDRIQMEEDLRQLNLTLESRVAERTESLDGARRDLRNIIDAMPAMVAYWDHNQINRFANRAYRTGLNLDPETLPGQSIQAVLSAESYAQSLPYIEGVLAGEEQQFERADAGRYTQARYVPDIVGGEVRGFYTFVSDITDLHKATEAAEAASAAKSGFLANMSHEIRTPMNAVMNLTYLLELTPLSAEQRDLTSKMKIASRSLLGLINDVLDLSKIEANKMGLTTEAFSLSGLVDDLAKVMSAQASSKRIELIVNANEELPDYLRGDSLRLNQVLSNLLSNAIKFTERGEVTLSVQQLERSSDSVTLRFEVSDTGIGIGEDGLARLFTPFTQADDSTTRRYGGSGLGLAIVKRLVELMGGELGVTSTLGKGSTFWVQMAFVLEQEGTIAARAPVSLDTLVVDDSDDQRLALMATARALGWRTEAVASGHNALDRISDRLSSGRPYDAIVIDWLMPDLDGLETLAELRKRHQADNLPAVIVVTAGDLAKLRQSPHVGHADAVLSKPVTPSTLFNAVHQAVAQHSGSFARVVDTSSLVAGFGQRLKDVSVLIVDDSSVNLDIGKRILEHEGAKVLLAVNGQQALDMVREQGEQIHIVLMDVQMPVMDGNEATRRIRQELGYHDLPIVALTAGALVSERERALAAGMTEFMSKPFDAEVMIGRIRRLVEVSRGMLLPLVSRADARVKTGSQTSIPGLNFDLALKRLGGDRQLLTAMIQRMLKEFGDFGAMPVQPKSDTDRHAMMQSAHKLRGIAGNVGAVLVQDAAAALEASARDAGSQDLQPLQMQLHKAMQNLKQAAEPLWASSAPPEPEALPPAGGVDTINREELQRLMRQLQQNNLGALQTFNRLAPDLQQLRGEAGSAPLRMAIQQLQFAEASTLLAQWFPELNGQ